jgi:hypothetical protein
MEIYTFASGLNIEPPRVRVKRSIVPSAAAPVKGYLPKFKPQAA